MTQDLADRHAGLVVFCQASPLNHISWQSAALWVCVGLGIVLCWALRNVVNAIGEIVFISLIGGCVVLIMFVALRRPHSTNETLTDSIAERVNARVIAYITHPGQRVLLEDFKSEAFEPWVTPYIDLWVPKWILDRPNVALICFLGVVLLPVSLYITSRNLFVAIAPFLIFAIPIVWGMVRQCYIRISPLRLEILEGYFLKSGVRTKKLFRLDQCTCIIRFDKGYFAIGCPNARVVFNAVGLRAGIQETATWLVRAAVCEHEFETRLSKNSLVG